MKRILEKSPVAGYQLFRWEKRKANGTTTVLAKYYVRHAGKDTSTKTDRLPAAKNFVKKMAGEQAHETRRKNAHPEEVTIGTLLDLVIEDYQANGQKTVKTVKGQIKHSLRPFFGDMLAGDLDTDRIEQWLAWRKKRRLRKSVRPGHEQLQPASINRELSVLRRAYQLGYERKPQLVEKIPPIKKLAENNVRKGFVSPAEYRSLLEELPAYLRGITVVAFHAANRKGELFNLEWPDVDLDGKPPIFTLWPGETKNKQGRTLPILEGEMMDTLRALKKEHDEKYPKETHVFLNGEGKPLQYHMMRKVWDDACTRANLPGLLFHDLRRSGVRNLRRAGVTQKVAREFSGHKTDSVFDRYNISDFDDLKDAAAKLATYLKQGEEKQSEDQAREETKA
jgi:integrase